MLTVKRKDVIEMFVGMRFSRAPEWDDKKLNLKIKELPGMTDDDDQPDEAAHKKLLKKLQDAVEDDQEINLVADAADDDASDSPSDDDDEMHVAADPSDDASGSPSDDKEDDDDDADSDDGDDDASGSPSDDPPKTETKPPKRGRGRPPKNKTETPTPPAAVPNKVTGQTEEFVGIRQLVERLDALTALYAGYLSGIAGVKLETPKKAEAAGESSGDKLADVVAAIEKMMRGTKGDKSRALSVGEMLDKLELQFESRDEKWLKEKLMIQLNGQLKKRGLIVKQTGDKYYAVESKD